MDGTREWYVVRTKPRREGQVEAVLSRRGVQVYLPLIPSRRRHEPEILFPGYVFSRLSLPSQEWLAARSAPGVSYFLGTEGEPTPIPDFIVEAIRERSEAQLGRGYCPEFVPGERVVITSGVLQGMEAIFGGVLSPTGRSRVFVGMISRLVPVELDVRTLERLH